VSLGTNLACLYGKTNNIKLLRIVLYKQLIELKFNVKIPLISSGSSVTIPLIRLGDLYLRHQSFSRRRNPFMGTVNYNVPLRLWRMIFFKLYAEIIELCSCGSEWRVGSNLEGNVMTFDDKYIGKSSIRAIIDIGLLDIDMKHLELQTPNVKLAETTSDMVVLDLGEI
jgi:predicted amino acid racemase